MRSCLFPLLQGKRQNRLTLHNWKRTFPHNLPYFRSKKIKSIDSMKWWLRRCLKSPSGDIFIVMIVKASDWAKVSILPSFKEGAQNKFSRPLIHIGCFGFTILTIESPRAILSQRNCFWINRFYYRFLRPSMARNGWHIWLKRIFFLQRQRNKY